MHPQIIVVPISLEEKLKHKISKQGAITLSEFMKIALFDPKQGYYTNKTVFGVEGDFVTSPEISQMFGELIALWALTVWVELKQPSAVTLIELGPGRGTLMADFCRTIQPYEAFYNGLDIWLIEQSPNLIQIQKKTLVGHQINWAGSLSDVPNGNPLIVIANEFFDALPIDHYIFNHGQWHERLIGLTDDNQLGFITGDPVSHILYPATQGDICEESTESLKIMDQIKDLILKNNGAGLIIDYGYLAGHGDSLQAVKNHAYTDILKNIGMADITAHVDFAAMQTAAAPLKIWGPITQRDFLTNMGIAQRAKRLKAFESMNRLIDPLQMGSLFKVLGLSHPSLRSMTGFD